MNPFAELQASPPPRPPALVRRLVPTLASPLGFIAYGLLYFPFLGVWVPIAALAVASLFLRAVFGYGADRGPPPPLALAGLGLAALFGVALAIWPFAWWVRRRRAPVRALFETGILVEAQVEELTQSTLVGGMTTLEHLTFDAPAHSGYLAYSARASISYAGGALRNVGDWRPLLVSPLVSPGSRLVVAFGRTGGVIGGRIIGHPAIATAPRAEAPPAAAAPAERVAHVAVPFAVRAVLALTFLFGFYALAFGLAAALVAVPYFEFTKLHRVSPRLALGCLAGAFAILRALVVAKAKAFHPPGPRLREDEQPELFAVIREVAAGMRTRMPADVYLIPDVNAFVAEVGGFLGFGTRRIMGIGLGLLTVDDVSNLKATLAHEFGHYTGGDTALGGVVYRTRASIGRVLGSLGRGVLAKPFEWYGTVYLHITQAVSRHQELEADRAGIRVAGLDAHIEGLEREARAGVAFGAFVNSELVPLCEAGMCPTPLYEGFTRFLASISREKLDALIAARKADRFDTHPAHGARLAFARSCADPGVVRDVRPAISLLRRAPDVEAELEPYLFTALGVRGALRRVPWSDVAASVYAPRLAEEARLYGERLFPLLKAGPAYRDVALGLLVAVESQSPPPVDLATALEPRMNDLPAGRKQEAAPKILARALGVLTGAALIERGGVWRTDVGAPLVVELEGSAFSPLLSANDAMGAAAGFAELRSML